MQAKHHLKASVREERGVAVIDLDGEINAFSEDELNAAYAETTGLQAARVLLNFSKAEYINSMGIALIVGLLAQARRADVRVLTFGLSAHYEEVFRITRLSDFMTICPDENSALAEATGGS